MGPLLLLSYPTQVVVIVRGVGRVGGCVALVIVVVAAEVLVVTLVFKRMFLRFWFWSLAK